MCALFMNKSDAFGFKPNKKQKVDIQIGSILNFVNGIEHFSGLQFNSTKSGDWYISRSIFKNSRIWYIESDKHNYVTEEIVSCRGNKHSFVSKFWYICICHGSGTWLNICFF